MRKLIFVKGVYYLCGSAFASCSLVRHLLGQLKFYDIRRKERLKNSI